VGVVAGAGHEAGGGQAGAQHVGAIDADVPALVRVVRVRQGPADPLRPVAGHGDGDAAARLEHSEDLRHRRGVVRDVLEHLRRDDPVDAGVGEGQVQQVAPDDLVPGGRTVASLPGLAGLGDRAQPPLRRLDLGRAPVDGDDRRTAPVGLEGVPSLAAAEVEQRHARPQAQAVVIDGQQGRPFRSSTAPYQAAVRSAVPRQV
jgi:hypothetical protein